MADLRVEQQTLTRAESVFSGAANRLGPVALAMKALDADAAGASVLAGALSAGDEGLAGGLQAVGKSLAGLAQFLGDADTAYSATDQALSRAVKNGV
jgi:hypothetical protein